MLSPRAGPSKKRELRLSYVFRPVSKATPRLIHQVSLRSTVGSLISITKLVEWPVVLRNK